MGQVAAWQSTVPALGGQVYGIQGLQDRMEGGNSSGVSGSWEPEDDSKLHSRAQSQGCC